MLEFLKVDDDLHVHLQCNGMLPQSVEGHNVTPKKSNLFRKLPSVYTKYRYRQLQ